MRKTARAFTLVELIVVIAIVAILMAMSIAALIGFRESARLNKTVNDFTSEAKTVLSRARNNVYTQDELAVFDNEESCATISGKAFKPDAAGYYFDDTQKNAKHIKCISTRLSLDNNYCCTIVEDVDAFGSENEDIEYISECDGVLFEYATGDLLRFNPEGSSGIEINAGSSASVKAVNENCIVTINHKKIDFKKKVLFDAENTAIEIQ